MVELNGHFGELPGNYLFSDVARKTAAFTRTHPEAEIIRLGIGDVTRPLAPAVIAALHKAADEMGCAATFRGYGPEQGHEFLREAIVRTDYRERGLDIAPDEIFVSDGAKCDVGNFQELFSENVRVAIGDPVYPVYRDSNIMAGRKNSIVYLPCTEANNFSPDVPGADDPVLDVIYLCSPNNPTGTVMAREALQNWVDYAERNGSLILFDSAYEAFIREEGAVHSIYEIPGARNCAVEFRSYSKTAGFTGLRCAYTVVPKTLRGNLNDLWRRRQCTKFNGTSYVVQRAAEAVHSDAGRREIAADIDCYLDNARAMREVLGSLGTVYGGVSSPYVWWKFPGKMTSAEFFDALLNRCAVVGTPGSGFGPSGEGFLRLTAFNTPEKTREALARIQKEFR